MATRYVSPSGFLTQTCMCLTSPPLLLQIVEVDMTTEGKTKLEIGMTLSFTYQVLSSLSYYI